MSESNHETPSDFIRELVEAEQRAGKHGGRVATRFPPEPNGYLHIGHAKAICLSFGIAAEFGGVCHLRLDDTNPTTEDPEYVEAIKRDVRWLGFDWGENLFYASDYFGRLYELGEKLIRLGRAYVCDLSEEEVGAYRGTLGEPGRDSPYRARTVDENLDLFRRMRAGEFAEGHCTLRAKIDMSSPNMKMRDPPLYRIKRAHHYRTGDAWCIYPLYDYAHCLSDSFERITNSLCTTEFESARELYDWIVRAAEVPWVPRQTEFARLNLTYTVMSKRKLLALVNEKHVRGWDDPRLPTLAGLRRRGVTPESIRTLCAKVGVAKNVSVVDLALFEHVLRDDLNARAPRVLAVLRPLKVVIENYPEGQTETFDAPYWPHDVPREGSRELPFSREIYVERDDFLEDPPKEFFRLAPGREVRLRHAYVVRCERVVKNDAGEVVELRCSYDPATRGGAAAEGKRVAGTIHWVSAATALAAEVRLYDRLFVAESPGAGDAEFAAELNPRSLETVHALVEPSLAAARPGERFQFERLGFFAVDPDSEGGRLVFNRTVTLRDTWGKIATKGNLKGAPGASAPPPPRAPKAKPGAGATPAHVAAPLGEEAQKLRDQHPLSDDEARTLEAEPALRSLFDEALAAGAAAKPAAVLLCNELRGLLRASGQERPPFGGAELAELIGLVASGALSSKQGKEVLEAMHEGKGPPRAIVEARGLRQESDVGAIAAIVDRVLAANADAAARYRAGNANVLGALVGMVVRESSGRANPKLASELLRAKLAP
ncbi:MAG: glutamine--tRNA ligase/YqeY domain fusion protein [Polyangiaceae bacterium]|nr:glutamine--tRNA ligase/YqeY domain fusion protein [Polyangiaceae bacterium]